MFASGSQHLRAVSILNCAASVVDGQGQLRAIRVTYFLRPQSCSSSKRLLQDHCHALRNLTNQIMPILRSALLAGRLHRGVFSSASADGPGIVTACLCSSSSLWGATSARAIHSSSASPAEASPAKDVEDPDVARAARDLGLDRVSLSQLEGSLGVENHYQQSRARCRRHAITARQVEWRMQAP